MTGVLGVGDVGIIAMDGSVGDMIAFCYALSSAVKVCSYAQSCNGC